MNRCNNGSSNDSHMALPISDKQFVHRLELNLTRKVLDLHVFDRDFAFRHN